MAAGTCQTQVSGCCPSCGQFAQSLEQHSHWQQSKPLHQRPCVHQLCPFGTEADRRIEDARSLLPSLRVRAILLEDRRMTRTNHAISGGVVHELPEDLRQTLAADAEALAAWEALTPLARNEWICWAISVKKPETRQQHVERVRAELKEGMRRPCCWYGCIHRTDKPISSSVQWVLDKQSKKSS